MSSPKRKTRRGPRFFKAVSRAIAKVGREGESVRGFACALCDANLPVFHLGELLFLQASLGFVCKAPAKEVCPLRHYLAARTTEERSTSLPPDSDRT